MMTAFLRGLLFAIFLTMVSGFTIFLPNLLESRLRGIMIGRHFHANMKVQCVKMTITQKAEQLQT